MIHVFELDPCAVLGIGPGASLQEVRDAYRGKSKRYHPDLGGDEWAFRVLHRCYEILSTARVAARVQEETHRSAQPRPQPHPHPHPHHDPDDGERVRQGVHESAPDPSRIVDVELLTLRFEMENSADVFFENPAKHNLSCSLNVVWPAESLTIPTRQIPDATKTLRDVAEACEALAEKTHALAARTHVDSGRLTSWLTYPTAILADWAFKVLLADLHERGLAVNQLSREMIIPRSWR
jgi:hypothetical protein